LRKASVVSSKTATISGFSEAGKLDSSTAC
jgi:hypothetical protein